MEPPLSVGLETFNLFGNTGGLATPWWVQTFPVLLVTWITSRHFYLQVKVSERDILIRFVIRSVMRLWTRVFESIRWVKLPWNAQSKQEWSFSSEKSAVVPIWIINPSSGMSLSESATTTVVKVKKNVSSFAVLCNDLYFMLRYYNAYYNLILISFIIL